jgi:hypothetical protein
VQLELSKWLAREVSEEKADEVIAYTQFCVIARWTPRLPHRRRP